MELIKSSIHQLQDITVPRRTRSGIWTDNSYLLGCFCGTSAKAYSAVIYLREVSEKGVTTNIWLSKSHLSPAKPLSIPRLELMAVVIGLKCSQFVKSQLKKVISQAFLWIDL